MSLEHLFRRFSSVQRDHMGALVAEAGAVDSMARLGQLDHEIDAIRVRLDALHREREALKDRLEAIDQVVKLIETYDPDSSDCDVAAFRLWLAAVANDTKSRLATLRPDADLARKRDLASERDLAVARQKYAIGLAKRLVVNGKPGVTARAPTGG